MTSDLDLRQQLESGPVVHFTGGPFALLELRYISDRVRPLTGYEPETFLGDASIWTDRIHPEDLPSFLSTLERVAAEPLDFDFRFRHADGGWRRLRVNLEPLRAEDGTVREIIGSFRDVTARAEIENALLMVEERLRIMVEESIQGVLVHRHWKPIYANQAYVSLLGYDSPAEVLALDLIREVYAPHERERMTQYQKLRMEGGNAPSLYEFDALRKDGSQITLQNLVRGIRWEGEFATLHSCIDVTKRKRAEGALLKSQSLYRQAQELANVGHWEWDELDSRLISCSEQCALIHGLSMEAMIERHSSFKSSLDVIHPDDLDDYVEKVRAYNRTAEFMVHEFRIVRPDGSVRHVHEVATPVLDENGRLVRSVGTIQDITARKEAERALRTLEERERLILESAGEGIYELDSKGRLVFINRTGADLLGYEPDELVGKIVHDVIHHSFADGTPHPRESCPIYAAFTDGHARRVMDDIFWRKDGSSFPVHYTSTPIFKDTVITGSVVVFADVTERRNADEKLRQSEARFAQAAKLAKLGHWEWDKLENRLVACSEQLAEILDMSVDEALATFTSNEAWLNVVHPDDHAGHIKLREEADAELKPISQEHRLITAKGNVRWVRKQARPVVGENGVLLKTVGTLLDVTEFKTLEAEVHQSQARLQAFIDHYPDPVFIKDAGGHIVLANPRYAENAGVDLNEIEGKHVRDLFGDDLNQSIRKYDQIVLNDQKTVWHEVRFSQDGNERIFETVKFPLIDPATGRLNIGGIDHDVTERRMIEEALRSSEEQLRLITNSLPALIVYLDRDCRFQFVNATARSWYARPADEILGKTIPEIVGEANFERLKPHVERVLSGEAHVFDTALDYPDGVRRNTHQTYTPRFNEPGEVVGFYAMVLDISERLKVEQALKEKEWQFDAIFEYSPPEIFLKDAEGRYVRVSKEFEKRFKVRNADVVGKFPNEVHMNFLKTFAREHDLEVFNTGKPVTREETTVYPDSPETRTFLTTKFPIFGEKGEITGLGAIASDITERKRAEDALKASERQLRLIADSLPVLILYFDQQLRYRFVNKTAESWYAMPQEHIVGRHPREILGDKVFRQIQYYFGNALRGVDGVYQERITYPDGNTRDIHAFYVADRDSSGNVPGFYVLVMDMTKNRAAQELVRRSRANLRKLAERLETAREEERRTVAYEIHDDIGQLLTALKLAVSDVFQHQHADPNSAPAEQDLVFELFDRLFDKVRSLARRLRPGLLDELGLEEAVTVHLEEISVHMDWKTRCHIELNGFQLPKDHETVVFRLIQEALTNAARHAEASEVEVRIRNEGDHVAVEVLDNGLGISDSRLDSSDSLGLIGLRERAGSVGGRLEIRRRQPRGTLIKLRLPHSGDMAEKKS